MTGEHSRRNTVKMLTFMTLRISSLSTLFYFYNYIEMAMAIQPE